MLFATDWKAGVAKGSEKKGTTKDTKSTKKSFFFLSGLRVLRGSRLLGF